MAITDTERREVAAWAAGSAARVLPLFEALVPTDPRPRLAIEAARAFAGGSPRSRQLSRIALDAHRAGGEAGDPIALAAARSASLAAATANLHGEGTIGTAGHILGPAAYAALAAELAGDPTAGDAELRWAVEQASPSIRALVLRVPPSAPAGRRPGGLRARIGALEARLDAALREIAPDSPGRPWP